jgi:ATP-dependent RNA helicase DDX24/MAK5
MVEKHCFPQLVQILEAVDNANPGEEDSDQEEDDEDDSEDQDDWLDSLPGVRGETKVAMLTDDILQNVDSLKAEPAAQSVEVADDEFEEEEEEIDDQGQLEDLYPSRHSRVKRQTFIYSATLTLPHTSTKGNSTVKKKRQRTLGLDGAIAEMLETARAMGETKIVDLSSSSTTVSQPGRSDNAPKGVRLPPGLELKQIKCTQRHKDSHLYAYLVTTAQGASGPCLVFCNSIACVRRVGSTLQKLGLPVRLLHAQMQQVRRWLRTRCMALR